MRFLTNAANPKLPDDKLALYLFREHDATPQQAVAHHREWLKEKIIGDPMATARYTVEQLKGFNLVGVYTEEPNEQAQEAEATHHRPEV